MISVLISDPGSKIQDPRSRGIAVRVVIAGGGTGGHVYPGLAIAEALGSTRPQTEVLFVGGGGLERRVVPQAGWPFRRVAARAWPRRLTWSLPWAMLLTVAGTAQAVLLLQRWRPQVVVATGGYAAAPIGAAAAVLKIPLVVQEQNLYPGAANRILARWARVISVPHERVAAHFGGKAGGTGGPGGAGTLAEVTANGLPVVAVPYPYAAEGHQEANARLLESAGAAVVVLDRESNGVRLAEAVDALRADPSRLHAMAMASARLGRPQAARGVAAPVGAAAGGGFSGS